MRLLFHKKLRNYIGVMFIVERERKRGSEISLYKFRRDIPCAA